MRDCIEPCYCMYIHVYDHVTAFMWELTRTCSCVRVEEQFFVCEHVHTGENVNILVCMDVSVL